MKDICGNDVRAGDLVHIWWDIPSMDGTGATHYDYLCTAVRTRGRGIKFVTDDDKTLTADFLANACAQIAIQGGTREERTPEAPKTDSVTTEELEMISKLRDKGWYGTLYKKSLLLSTFRIEMPELERK